MMSVTKDLLKRHARLGKRLLDLRDLAYGNLMTDEQFLKSEFRRTHGRKLNLKTPEKYSDKLQWLKLYWRDNLAAQCADKYDVRTIVKETIGEQYLNECYGVYRSVAEIPFGDLPESFVLKGTHGSGFNILCRDKSKLDRKSAANTMDLWLHRNQYLGTREWVYQELEPRIICERYLQDQAGKVPMDYKIYCFHGEPKLIQVDIDRFGVHKQNFYNTNWEYQDVRIWCETDCSMEITRPKRLGEMLEISKKLSERFPHVRVDLYHMEAGIIFGELTFFHMSGLQKFKDDELELAMGNWLRLEQIDKNGVYRNSMSFSESG